MHSRYAAVFGIENLQLNTHFAPTQKTLLDSEAVAAEVPPDIIEPLDLSNQLLADIKRAAVPIAINEVVHGAQIQLNGEQLKLPKAQLSVADKRALWLLMSEHLDKF